MYFAFILLPLVPILAILAGVSIGRFTTMKGYRNIYRHSCGDQGDFSLYFRAGNVCRGCGDVMAKKDIDVRVARDAFPFGYIDKDQSND